MKSPTSIDVDSDNTGPKPRSISAAEPRIKPGWAELQFYPLEHKAGRNAQFSAPCHSGRSSGAQTPPHQVLRSTPSNRNPHFLPWEAGAQVTNKLPQVPKAWQNFLLDMRVEKNANLLRSWLVSFCDNCLSSLKPPTRCTSSLTEME